MANFCLAATIPNKSRKETLLNSGYYIYKLKINNYLRFVVFFLQKKKKAHSLLTKLIDIRKKENHAYRHRK